MEETAVRIKSDEFYSMLLEMGLENELDEAAREKILEDNRWNCQLALESIFKIQPDDHTWLVTKLVEMDFKATEYEPVVRDMFKTHQHRTKEEQLGFCVERLRADQAVQEGLTALERAEVCPSPPFPSRPSIFTQSHP